MEQLPSSVWVFYVIIPFVTCVVTLCLLKKWKKED